MDKMDWEMRDSVQSVIERRLPCPDIVDPTGDSLRLVWDRLHRSEEAIWHEITEQKNLKALRRALIHAQRAWHRLHPVLRCTVIIEVSKGPPEPKAPDEYGTALRRWEENKMKSQFVSTALPDIADFFEPGISAAKETIKYGLPKGRTGWAAIVVIGHCRNIWDRRTEGKRAPSRGLDVSAPFGLFTKEIFKACKLKFSHGAFDA